MPVIVRNQHCEEWLGHDDPRSELFKWALDHPSEEPMKIYPVSSLVNNPSDTAPVGLDLRFQVGGFQAARRTVAARAYSRASNSRPITCRLSLITP
jgi:hypothetical protein